MRSPEQLIEKLAGVTPDEARAMVRVGEILTTGGEGHTNLVAQSVAAGDVSVRAADAILVGLGEPNETVSTEALTDAAALLLDVAQDTRVKRMAAEARALRDSIDTAAVAERERAQYESRYLHLKEYPDGSSDLNGHLDPESTAIAKALFHPILAPRRGGPRFVDPDAAERSQQIIDDPRTNGQLLLDAFIEMIRIAGAADDGRVFSQRKPAVQIHVAARDLERGVGAAHFDGETVAVSVATAQRWACTAGGIPILFNGDRSIDVGRTERLFTARQRVALAAEWGGCGIDGCDRPPSWTEAHHINEWERDNGATDLANGVLLCRFHHRWVHNGGWKIERRGSKLFAVPPPGDSRAEIPLTRRNPTRP
jgi:Domain of unknown function (DUF222)